MFDEVLLLAKGGRTVYLGPTLEAQRYFEELGYKIPPKMNPADFLMDVISGEIESTRPQVLSLPEIWETRDFTAQGDSSAFGW